MVNWMTLISNAASTNVAIIVQNISSILFPDLITIWNPLCTTVTAVAFAVWGEHGGHKKSARALTC